MFSDYSRDDTPGRNLQGFGSLNSDPQQATDFRFQRANNTQDMFGGVGTNLFLH